MNATSPTIIELRTGLWMVKEQAPDDAVGTIRGYITRIELADGVRFLARLPHLNPTQGLRIGEYWEWGKAVAAVLEAQPRPLIEDPFKDLRYSDPAERQHALERSRQRRRFAGRFS